MADKELIAGKKNDKKDFFSSKPVIFLISLFFSLAIWCVVSMYETPETDRIFQDVKVQMNLNDSVPGLMNMIIFGNNEFYCDITVNGKSYLVNDSSFTSDKIIVKPKLEDIRTPGIYEVELTAQLINSSADLSIISIQPQFITVYFDTPVEKEFDLTLIGADDYTLADNCVIESMKLRPATVLAVGPSMEMNYIREIKAVASFSEPVSESTQHPVTLEFVADGKAINYTTIKDEENIYLDVQVSVFKTFDIKIDILNAPAGLDIENIIDYSLPDMGKTISLYVPTESTSLLSSEAITIGRIDMSAFALKNKQTLSVERYNRSIFYDVLSDNFDADFTLNTENLTTLNLNIPVRVDESGFEDHIFANELQNVTLIIDASRVEELNTEEIYAIPNTLALARMTSGAHSVIATVVLPADCDFAWVSGEYTVEVQVP